MIPSSIESSLIQTAQAQQAAAKGRDREKKIAEEARTPQDTVELRVAGVEDADAIRRLPRNDSEQAEEEQRGQQRRPPDDGSTLDVRA